VLGAEAVQAQAAGGGQFALADRAGSPITRFHGTIHRVAERTFRDAGQDVVISPTPASAGGGDDLHAAIAALWQEARPRTVSRIDTIDQAVAALHAGALGGELAELARREAHKLAGSLGTFGMPAGTDHARALEHALNDGLPRAAAPELAARVAALRRIVEQGPG
jgi:HPt (histidine-containing phosphotransfer) domain-containing protein